LKAAPLGWRREIFGVLASAALVLVAYHPVAFGGKTFDTSTLVQGVNGIAPPTGVARPKLVDEIRPDLGAGAWGTVPWAQVTHREVAKGRWPLWTPYEGIGEPLAGNMQSATFDPLMLAVNLHPTTLTWDLTFLFAFMLGSIATYLFLRNLGIGALAAVAGAGAFTMSGWFAMDNSDTFVRLYAYLPVLFLMVDMVIGSPKLRWVAALGAAIAGSILAGMPESTFFVLVVAAAYALFGTVRASRGAPQGARSSGDLRWPAALRLGAAGAFGLALASPLLILFAQFLPLSANIHAVGIGLRTGATGALLYWLIPFANGYPMRPLVSGFDIDRGWVGAAVGTLAAVAAAAPRAMREFSGWFFLTTAAVVLAKNHNIPFVQWIGQLPGFSQADWKAFAPPVAGFCLAVVAAIGIHALATGDVQRRRLAIGATALAAVVGLLLIANRPVLAAAHGAFAWRNYALTISAASAVLGAAVAVVTLKDRSWVRQVAPAIAALAVLAEVYALFPQHIYAPRADPYRRPPWLAMVEVGTATEPYSRVFGLDQILYPNTAGVFGLYDARTLNALYVSRYVTYLNNFIFPFVDRFTGDGFSSEDVQANSMFDLLGVRYVVTAAKELDRFAGAGQYRFVGDSGGVKVYENTHGLARAFVTDDVHQVASTQDAVSYLRSLGHPAGPVTRLDRFDPLRQAVVETSRGTPVSLPPSAVGPMGSARSARIASYGPQRVEVDVAAGDPGLLVLTDSYFPGWRATVNGHPASILPTDIAFRGVVLDGTNSKVVFSYHAPGGDMGWAIPLLGALCLGAAGLTRTVRRIRSASPEVSLVPSAGGASV
jgi:hypothetical protein